RGEALVGYGSVWPQRRGRFRLDLLVDPMLRRRGIGSSMLVHLLSQLRVQNACLVQARTREERGEALEFLGNRGFVETNRMADLRLLMEDVNLAPYLSITERLA